MQDRPTKADEDKAIADFYSHIAAFYSRWIDMAPGEERDVLKPCPLCGRAPKETQREAN